MIYVLNNAKNIPIIFNIDFDHVRPFITFTIEGTIRIEASDETVSLLLINISYIKLLLKVI